MAGERATEGRKGCWAILRMSTITVIVSLLAIYLFVAWRMAPTTRGPLTADLPAAQSLLEGVRQDLDFLTRYAAENKSFDDSSRAAFLKEVGEMQSDAASLDRAALEMRVARAVALAGDSHSNVRGVGYGLSLNAFPVRLAQFDDGFHIIAAAPNYRNLLGSRVISIDGRTTAQLAEALRPYVGGTDAFRAEHLPNFLISPAALHAVGLAAAADRAIIRVENAAGVQADIMIAADPDPANGQPVSDPDQAERRESRWPRRYLSPVPFPGDRRPWVHVLTNAAGLPLYLRQPDDYFWAAELPGKTLFVQVNVVADKPQGVGLENFLDGMLLRIKKGRVHDVVLDLRSNTGGNSDLTMGFTHSLNDALPASGRVFILVSGNSFSAAIITAARLKYFGRGRTLIIGSPMGDGPIFWAEGRNMILPNSEISIKSTAAYHNWRDGCGLSDLLRCYLPNYLNDVPAGALTPDVIAPRRWNDYVACVDEDLAIAMHMIGRKKAAKR
jgi:hypothetical protein